MPTPSSLRHVQPSCGALDLSTGGFVLHRLTVPAWCTGIPACLGRHNRVNGSYRLCFALLFAMPITLGGILVRKRGLFVI